LKRYERQDERDEGTAMHVERQVKATGMAKWRAKRRGRKACRHRYRREERNREEEARGGGRQD